jgi:hypothetical protein
VSVWCPDSRAFPEQSILHQLRRVPPLLTVCESVRAGSRKIIHLKFFDFQVVHFEPLLPTCNLHWVAPPMSRYEHLQYSALRRRMEQEPSTPSDIEMRFIKMPFIHSSLGGKGGFQSFAATGTEVSNSILTSRLLRLEISEILFSHRFRHEANPA